MILGCEGLAGYHCGLQGSEVPVSTGNPPHLPRVCSALVDSKRGKLETKTDWHSSPLTTDVTGAFCVDLTTRKSPDRNESGDDIICLNSEGINLYIDLSCSPGTDSSAERPPSSEIQKTLVEKRTRRTFESDVSTAILPLSVSVNCLDCPKPCGIGLSPLNAAYDRFDISWNEVLDAKFENFSEFQEMLETQPSLDLMRNSSSTQDGLEELAAGSKAAERETVRVADCPLISHELTMPCQGQLTTTGKEKSEMKLASSSRGNHRVLAEPLDNLPYLKRRRLTTGSASDMRDIHEHGDAMQRLEMPIKGGLGGHVSGLGSRYEGQAGQNLPRFCSEKLGIPGLADDFPVSLSSSNGKPAQLAEIREEDGLASLNLVSQLNARLPDQKDYDCDIVDVVHEVTKTLSQPVNLAGEELGVALSDLASDAEKLRMTALGTVQCDTLENPEIPEFPRGGRLPEQELPGSIDFQEKGRLPDQVELCHTVEMSESKILPKGTYAIRALLDTGEVQRLKRRRMTTPIDAPAVRDFELLADNKTSPAVGFRPSNGLSVLSKCERRNEMIANPDLDVEVQVSGRSTPVSNAEEMRVKDSICSTQAENTEETSIKDFTGTDYHIAQKSLQTKNFGAANTFDNSQSFGGKFFSDGFHDTLGPIRKDWLSPHYSGNADIEIRRNVEFVSNVGHFYRSAIDQRPAALYPGFVGDGTAVQICRVCGGKEDAHNSLICDSCEELFHMTCVNSRMKVVPRVDEWLCRQCKRKRKMGKEGENQGDSDLGADPKDWWRDDSGIGKVEKELLRMSNGRRTKVRIGPNYQADVPEKIGALNKVDMDDTLAEPESGFGNEVPLTSEEKHLEQAVAEYNVAHKIWPLSWLPADQVTPIRSENWLQCSVLLLSKGEISPQGWKADKDIFCGKWRRAPDYVMPSERWECSCAIVWDPHHADCSVPQEMSTEKIAERMKAARVFVQQGLPL